MGKATVIKVDGSEEELDHRPSLEESQKIVGGYIEITKCNSIPPKRMVVNEEGRLQGLPVNRAATSIHNCGVAIMGNVIVLEGWKTVGS